MHTLLCPRDDKKLLNISCRNERQQQIAATEKKRQKQTNKQIKAENKKKTNRRSVENATRCMSLNCQF